MKVRSDYEAAHEVVALAPPRGRRFLKVTGKAPGEMLKGLLAGSIPLAGSGRVTYSAVLTAKGKMITDLRVFSPEEETFLLDVPEAGADGLRAHFARFLPPRLARVEDVTREWALVSLVGPGALPLLDRVLASGREDGGGEPGMVGGAENLVEGDELLIPDSPFGPIRLVPNGDVRPPAWDVLLPADAEEAFRDRLTEGGAHPMDPQTLEVLQVERGRPVFGREMTEDTIPVEAGIHTRAIDYGKGCYTGQEVIIRLRDRGQVNKMLRGLILGGETSPAHGLELFVPDREKGVGWITTACRSPAFQGTIALAYLRRGVEPGDRVRVGSPEGSEAIVRALDEEGWVLE